MILQRQEQKRSDLDEQLKEYIAEWRKQRAKEEEELKRLKVIIYNTYRLFQRYIIINANIFIDINLFLSIRVCRMEIFANLLKDLIFLS